MTRRARDTMSKIQMFSLSHSCFCRQSRLPLIKMNVRRASADQNRAEGCLRTQREEDCGPTRWLYPHCITDTTPGTPLSSSHLYRRRWGDCIILSHSFLHSCSRSPGQNRPTDVRHAGGAKPLIFTHLSDNFVAAVFMDCAPVPGQPREYDDISPSEEFYINSGGHILPNSVIFCKWAPQPVAVRIFLIYIYTNIPLRRNGRTQLTLPNPQTHRGDWKKSKKAAQRKQWVHSVLVGCFIKKCKIHPNILWTLSASDSRTNDN